MRVRRTSLLVIHDDNDGSYYTLGSQKLFKVPCINLILLHFKVGKLRHAEIK